MMRLRQMVITFVLPLVLTACMGAKYQITTYDGETYLASDDPQYDVEADTYMFLDENGKEVLLKKQEIQFIKEQ